MKRKIYDQLLAWKNQEKSNVALLIDGARRIGKSYTVAEFGKKEYKSHIIIDFNNADKAIFDLFDYSLNNLNNLFTTLQSVYDTRLYERESLIVFDEVQLCPRARAAIKYLVADGRYDYIETGSLVSINKNVKDIIIPSEERRIPMYPMDFEEFLWAVGNDMLMDSIRLAYEKKQPMGDLLHRKAMTLFRQYMIVGGMPQAVKTFVRNGEFTSVDRVKRDILALYKSDIEKYATGYESKVKSIFNNIPGALQKHDKKFRLSSIKKTARFREYESSFFWLQESQVMNIGWAATEPTVGLRMRMDNMRLKCYMADTGLLISHAFDERHINTAQLYQKLLLDKLELNKGMLVENMVAQMLRTNGNELYFFSQYSEDASENMEIDFLIQSSGLTSRHNIVPIEVKSSNGYTLASLEKFRKKYAQQITEPIVIHYKDLQEKDGILYLPIYMTPLL